MRPALRVALLAVTLVLAACSGAPRTTDDSTAAPTTETTTDATTAAATDAADSGTDDEALKAVADAAEATADAGTVRFEVTLETEGTAGDDGPQPLQAEGAEDFDAEQREVTFTGPGGELRALIDATDVYIEVPGTEDDTWARVELDTLIGGDTGFGGPAGLPFRSATDNLAILSDAVSNAAEGGEEDIDGEPATRYDLTVDLEQAAENAAEANETWEAVAEESGVTELAMQVWVDDEDLIRRIAYSLDLSQAEIDAATEGAELDADPQGVVTITVDYFDYGSEVEIELPEEESIVDIDEDEIRDSLQAPATGG